jgi:hypothetical protein
MASVRSAKSGTILPRDSDMMTANKSSSPISSGATAWIPILSWCQAPEAFREPAA